jgi:hypothetical protein
VKHAETSVIVRVHVVGTRIADRLTTLGITKTEAALRTGLSLRTIQRAIAGSDCLHCSVFTSLIHREDIWRSCCDSGGDMTRLCTRAC